MANPRIRINIPKKPAELIGLAKRVNEKHLADSMAEEPSIRFTPDQFKEMLAKI